LFLYSGEYKLELGEMEGIASDVVEPLEQPLQLCARIQYPFMQVAKGLQHWESLEQPHFA